MSSVPSFDLSSIPAVLHLMRKVERNDASPQEVEALRDSIAEMRAAAENPAGPVIVSVLYDTVRHCERALAVHDENADPARAAAVMCIVLGDALEAGMRMPYEDLLRGEDLLSRLRDRLGAVQAELRAAVAAPTTAETLGSFDHALTETRDLRAALRRLGPLVRAAQP
jgi:hypothetical protein